MHARSLRGPAAENLVEHSVADVEPPSAPKRQFVGPVGLQDVAQVGRDQSHSRSLSAQRPVVLREIGADHAGDPFSLAVECSSPSSSGRCRSAGGTGSGARRSAEFSSSSSRAALPAANGLAWKKLIR